MKLAMMMSTFMLLSNHPMSMIMVTIILTLIIMMVNMMILKTSWMSMIILLMMLGGMLIMFIYIASISPNNLLMNPLINIMIPIIILMTFSSNEFPLLNFNMNLMFQLFSSNSMVNSIFIMSYLLYSLYIILKMINKFNSPLVYN